MSYDNLEISIEQEVSDVKMARPHVVLLGAGASRAACANGDKNGKTLPLMHDFIDVVGLNPLLGSLNLNTNQNFEDVFSDLYEKGETDKIVQIETLVEDYFDHLELP